MFFSTPFFTSDSWESRWNSPIGVFPKTERNTHSRGTPPTSKQSSRAGIAGWRPSHVVVEMPVSGSAREKIPRNKLNENQTLRLIEHLFSGSAKGKLSRRKWKRSRLMTQKCGKSEKPGMVSRHSLAIPRSYFTVSPPNCKLKHFNASNSPVSRCFGPSWNVPCTHTLSKVPYIYA